MIFTHHPQKGVEFVFEDWRTYTQIRARARGGRAMTTEIWTYRARCRECGWASPEVPSLRTPCPRWVVWLLTTLYYGHRYLGARHTAWEWSQEGPYWG